MNRPARAPIPQAWRQSIADYHSRMRIRRLGRIAEADRLRVLEDIARNANADMSPFADTDRRGRQEFEL